MIGWGILKIQKLLCAIYTATNNIIYVFMYNTRYVTILSSQKFDKYVYCKYNQIDRYIYLIETPRMPLLRRRVSTSLFTLIGILFMFLSFSYSDSTMIGFTEFMFLSGSNETQNVTFETTWWDTVEFSTIIYNKEDISMTYKLWFVDAWVTNDTLEQKTCLSPNINQQVGQYIVWDTSPFTLAAHSTWTKTLSLTFPNSHSWMYHGCVTLNAITNDWTTHMNTLPTRGIFIDAQVTPLTSDFTLTVRPAFRPNNGSTGYALLGSDFWLFTYENSSWTWKYNSAKNILDSKINTNSAGTATVSFIPPASGTLFLVAFKGSGTLSLWFTGIRNDTITWFNFFSWTLADSLDNEFMFSYYESESTGKYLKVGDILVSNSGTYDYIKDQDFSLMTNNLTISNTPTHPYWFDLDINHVINALEETMLLDSYNRIGFIASQGYISMNEFTTF